MNWPSKRIPQGGIFHPPKAHYSPETCDFVKVLLKESKLSALQRQKAAFSLRSGDSLPSLAAGDSRTSTSRNRPEVLIRPGSSKRRSQNTIIESGAYEREKFVPMYPRLDRDKAKRHLQDHMAYGRDVAPTLRRPNKLPQKDVQEVDENRFDQLVEEIKERRQWLEEMEKLGEGEKYKNIIELQIQSKLREMEALEVEKNIKNCLRELGEATTSHIGVLVTGSVVDPCFVSCSMCSFLDVSEPIELFDCK